MIGADVPRRVATQLLHEAHAFVGARIHEAPQFTFAVPADDDRDPADGSGEEVVRILGLGGQANEDPSAFEYVLHFERE